VILVIDELNLPAALVSAANDEARKFLQQTEANLPNQSPSIESPGTAFRPRSTPPSTETCWPMRSLTQGATYDLASADDFREYRAACERWRPAFETTIFGCPWIQWPSKNITCSFDGADATGLHARTGRQIAATGLWLLVFIAFLTRQASDDRESTPIPCPS
jgi:hypothetical protein